MRVFTCIIPPGVRRCRLSIIIRCEGSCVHQGLSSSWFEAYRSSIRCLLDSFPLLQAAFIALLGGFSTPGSRCERSGINLGGSSGIPPYHVVSAFWVAHGEVLLIDLFDRFASEKISSKIGGVWLSVEGGWLEEVWCCLV